MFSFCLWQLSSVVNTCMSCRNSIFELIRHQFCSLLIFDIRWLPTDPHPFGRMARSVRRRHGTRIPQSSSPGQLAGHRNWPVYAELARQHCQQVLVGDVEQLIDIPLWLPCSSLSAGSLGTAGSWIAPICAGSRPSPWQACFKTTAFASSAGSHGSSPTRPNH